MKEDLKDLFGFIGTLYGLGKYGHEINQELRKLSQKFHKYEHLYQIWYHNNLAVRVRPWLWGGILVNWLIAALCLAWLWTKVPVPEGSSARLVATVIVGVAQVVPAILSLVALIRIWGTHSIDLERVKNHADYTSALEDYAQQLASYTLALNAVPPPDPLPTAPVAPPVLHPDELLTEEEMMQLSETRRLRSSLAFIAFFSGFFFTALSFFTVSGWLYSSKELYVDYPYVFLFILVGVCLPGFLGVRALQFLAEVLGGVLIEGGDIFNRVLNIVLRVVLTAAFGITKENYSEVMPKPFDLPTRAAGNWLKNLPITPLTFLSLIIPWFLGWPLLWVTGIMVALLVSLAIVSYARVKKGGMDASTGEKAVVLLISGVEIFVAFWRVIQFIFWCINDSPRVTPLTYYLNVPVGWFNHFASLDGDWYKAPLIAVVAFSGIVYAAYRWMPSEGKLVPKLRWAVIAVFASFALVVVVGQVFRYTGASPMHVDGFEVAARDLPRCTRGLTRCGETCLDTSLNSGNCGACGHVCGRGSYCYQATCYEIHQQSPTNTAHPHRVTPSRGRGHARPSARLASNGLRPCSRIGDPANPQNRFRALSARRGLCDPSR